MIVMITRRMAEIIVVVLVFDVRCAVCLLVVIEGLCWYLSKGNEEFGHLE